MRLYARRPVQSSLRTISGVLARSTSNPIVTLTARRFSSACQRRRYNSPISSAGNSSTSNSVVTTTSERVRKPGWETALRPKLDTLVGTSSLDLLLGERISKRQVGRLLERREDQAELISWHSGREIN